MDIIPEALSYLGEYYLVAVGLILLLFLYANEKSLLQCQKGEQTLQPYFYDEKNGPQTWKNVYCDSKGSKQSPINLISGCAITIPTETESHLVYSPEYYSAPKEMRIINNGYNVLVHTNWGNCELPSIKGGPLKEPYKLLSLRFRWGTTDEEGSEHMVDSKSFAMEMQLFYIKGSFRSNCIVEAAKNSALLIVSYFYLITPTDNPYIELIVSKLKAIQYPYCSVCIEPIPPSLLAPAFKTKFFTYIGSLSYPPCTEGIRWIVQPEPLTISSRQVKKFRKLMGIGGPIMKNTRPVQKLNDRDVFFYD